MINRNIKSQLQLVPKFGDFASCSATDEDFRNTRSVKKILMVTDFSQYAELAENRAAMLGSELKCQMLEIMAARSGEFPSVAEHDGAEIDTQAMSVQDKATYIESGLKSLSKRMKEWEQLPYVCSIRFGKPTTEILNRAEMMPADLIVVGAYNGNFITNFFRGYSVDKLIRLSKRPILIVKQPAVSTYRKVLVAVDFSEESREAVLMALAVAPKADIVLVHVAHVHFEGQMRETGIPEELIDKYRIKAIDEGTQKLGQFISALGRKNQPIQGKVLCGFPAAQLIKFARQICPDLIAVGKHGSSWFEDQMIGSVAKKLTEYSDWDFLVAPVSVDPLAWHIE